LPKIIVCLYHDASCCQMTDPFQRLSGARHIALLGDWCTHTLIFFNPLISQLRSSDLKFGISA
jgi:hypothetical protein